MTNLWLIYSKAAFKERDIFFSRMSEHSLNASFRLNDAKVKSTNRGINQLRIHLGKGFSPVNCEGKKGTQKCLLVKSMTPSISCLL